MANAKNKSKSVKQRIIAIIVVAVVIAAAVIGYVVTQNRKAAATASDTVVKIGVDSNSYDDIWQAVNQVLAKEKAGVKVKLVVMDGSQINGATDKKELDLNAFQHRAYLDDQVKQEGYNLEVYANTLIQPLNVYSDHIKSLDELKDGDSIAVPNNPTNLGRALKVLESAGVLKTDPSKGYLPNVNDIIENPKHIKIVPVDYAQVARVLPDNAAGIINSNNALDAGLDPQKDAIYHVKVNPDDIYNKPWVNLIVGRKGEQKNEAYRKVVEAYGSDEVKKVIDEKHKSDSIYLYKNLLDGDTEGKTEAAK